MPSILGWLWPLAVPVSFVLGVRIAEISGLERSPSALLAAVAGAVLFWMVHAFRPPLGAGASASLGAGRGRPGQPRDNVGSSWQARRCRRVARRLVAPQIVLLSLACAAVFYALPSLWTLVLLVAGYLALDRTPSERAARVALRWVAGAAVVALVVGALTLTLGRHLLRWYALQDSSIPTATDLATYYWGPVVLFEHVADPYSNQAWRDLLEAGLFELGHPNPAVAEVIERNIESDQLGYVASPFDLILFRPLGSLRFGWIYNLWPVLCLAALSASTFWLSWLLSGDWPRRLRFAGSAAASILLVLAFEPALSSALGFGQLEGLYVPLVLVALGLLYRQLRRNEEGGSDFVAGAALALAAAIKIFPAALGLVLVAGWRSLSARRALAAMAVTGLLLGALTVAVVGPGIVGAWVDKLGEDPFVREARWRHDLAGHFELASERVGGPARSFPAAAGFVLGALLVAIGWAALRRAPLDCGQLLLYRASFVLVALPSAMPLWWNLYHTVLAPPFLVAGWSLALPRTRPLSAAPGTRWAGIAMAALAWASLNAYALLDDLVGQLRPGALEELPRWLQRVVAESVGYPGSLALFLALLLSLRYLVLASPPPARDAAPPTL